MRSKSMENFFQRSNAESRLPAAIITSPPPQPSPPAFSESPLGYERSPAHSPSVSPNLSLSSHSPVSPSPSVTSKTSSQAQPTQSVKTHCFQEYVFRRPTNCHTCKHVIQGKTIHICFYRKKNIRKKVILLCRYRLGVFVTNARQG